MLPTTQQWLAPEYLQPLLKKYHPVPSIVLGLFILLLSSLPGAAFPSISWADAIAPDKWVHAFLFFAWFLLWKLSATQGRPVVAFALMLLWGACIEVFQEYVLTYRSGEWLDLAADFVGLAVGLFIVLRMKFK